jgi:plasmid stabilization system protein ParE
VLRVEISAAAERDLEEIAEYIARDDIVAAEGWVAKLVALARAAATNPRAGRVVPEWRDERVREVFHEPIASSTASRNESSSCWRSSRGGEDCERDEVEESRRTFSGQR